MKSCSRSNCASQWASDALSSISSSFMAGKF
jgi:hypothetical protein